MVDPSPYTSWSSWGAGQRDLFFLDADGNYHTDFNITTWNFTLIYNTIMDLLPEDALAGDTNGDGILNVLDVVAMVNQVLSGGYDEVADMNSDGELNILDVVSLMNQILANAEGGLVRGKTTTEAAVKYGNGMMSYESDGVIAGVQLFVSGDFEITDSFLPSGWDMSSNE